MFYLYQRFQCRDNYFFKMKFVFFLYLRLSVSWKENDLTTLTVVVIWLIDWYPQESGYILPYLYIGQTSNNQQTSSSHKKCTAKTMTVYQLPNHENMNHFWVAANLTLHRQHNDRCYWKCWSLYKYLVHFRHKNMVKLN